jgi:ABC-type branched-subunit amino acid transport system substrate-binding protein
MFGGDVQATTVIVRSPDDLQRDARRVKATALIGGEDLSTCLALADVARELGALHFNVSCTADALRDADCRRHSFHICPSDAMLRDTRTQLKMPLDARVTAWDPALDRFGADTLNRRFEARFRRPMTADAWCGWFAAKVLWEGALRARSTDAQALTTYLESDTASFDGHKGRPLSFRAWDHQLRQPVYLMGGSTGVGILEAPASAGPEEASRDMLDRIGTPAARTTCRWTGQ